MQSKPIRNADFNVDTAKHVTFYNEKFKRGRCDLLVEIQRTTRGGGSTHSSNEDQARHIQELKQQVSTLETKIESLNKQFDDRVRRLELDMLSKMEQIMVAMQQQHQQQQHQRKKQKQVHSPNKHQILRMMMQQRQLRNTQHPHPHLQHCVLRRNVVRIIHYVGHPNPN
mmetsp:Transcript_3818/g.5587  ORF Transcript_3818/g.5587 Transcript_3818/m.5587 type:complete len:169 (-) Transcript_3818:450-956(-)